MRNNFFFIFYFIFVHSTNFLWLKLETEMDRNRQMNRRSAEDGAEEGASAAESATGQDNIPDSRAPKKRRTEKRGHDADAGAAAAAEHSREQRVPARPFPSRRAVFEETYATLRKHCAGRMPCLRDLHALLALFTQENARRFAWDGYRPLRTTVHLAAEHAYLPRREASLLDDRARTGLCRAFDATWPANQFQLQELSVGLTHMLEDVLDDMQDTRIADLQQFLRRSATAECARTRVKRQTGWIAYYDEQRPKLAAVLGEVPISTINKEISKRWKALSNDERAEYAAGAPSEPGTAYGHATGSPVSCGQRLGCATQREPLEALSLSLYGKNTP